MRNRDTEEQLTDLTTVYLGFGVFTLESSFVFRTGHRDEQGQQLLWESRRGGYSTSGQLAFLLAVQAVVRGLEGDRVPEIVDALSPNQANAAKLRIDDQATDRREQEREDRVAFRVAKDWAWMGSVTGAALPPLCYPPYHASRSVRRMDSHRRSRRGATSLLRPHR